MGEKIKRIYAQLVEGAQSGFTGAALYEFVREREEKATSKKIVRASLLALSDPDLKDANILHAIYALAIQHRLDPATEDDSEPDDATDAPKLKPGKRKAEAAEDDGKRK